ncbi:sugar ABC transporter substrate-binding protein [Streptomyces sp. Pv4-95]|uniref:ABC transporter substrate-binding protein n=1 Tax=Streptomyces sp. Pv4-95 TaxID=3049543 RepID=UPI003891278F
MRRAVRKARTAAVLGTACLLAAAGTGCAPQTARSAAEGRTVTYWMWDANQRPAYEECAKSFERENPGLTVRITQIGFDNYWTKLMASFLSGTQPDVFTNHPAKYPQFAKLGVLSPLDELGPTAHLRSGDYQPGLADTWIGQDGHRYGAPKDWDTVGLFHDRKVTRKAGLSEKELNSLSWNPRDGGSFEKALARLTVDADGRRGDQPGFDKSRVVRYGLATNDAGTADGQTQWSAFTGSAGWRYTDRPTWGRHYNYDQKTFQETIGWYFGLAKKGYMAPFEVFSDSNPPEAQLGSGQAALALSGSWMTRTFDDLKGVDTGIALTPKGPSGKRASMMSGLADSVTKKARNKQDAAKWVAFLASDTCQRMVGEDSTVFPATRKGTEAAIAGHRRRGLDVSAFTRQVEDRTTFSFPVTDHASDITSIMTPVMQDVYANDAPLSTLTEANRQINFLFQQDKQHRR